MHGIKVIEINSGARAIAAASTAIIALIATASAAVGAPTTALDAAFPKNTLTLVTDVHGAVEKAGTGGTLAKSLAAIADQCRPVVVVLRVEEGANAAATDTAIVEAIPKLLGAESLLGVRPRILGVPGFDSATVTAALVPVAQQLRGMVYAAAVGDDVEDAITYRESYSARELMLIDNDFTDWSGSAIARALGLRARIDSETGWHKTLSNVGVNGVTGLAKARTFDMVNGEATDAGLLNAADVTTIIRANGFRYWGNRTCSDEPLFAFESVVRTAQVLQDEIAAGLVWAIDKPITGSLVKDIVDTVNAKFRQLQAQNRIIGARCWFDPAANPSSALAAGSVTIDYEYTPCAPAENILLNQRITDKFYATLADQLG